MYNKLLRCEYIFTYNALSISKVDNTMWKTIYSIFIKLQFLSRLSFHIKIYWFAFSYRYFSQHPK